MRRVETTAERLLESWPYALALIPAAADWISRDHHPTSLRHVVTDAISGLLVLCLVAVIQKKSRQLDEFSVTDKLTGLFNSRYLRAQLDRQVALARRTRSPLSLIFIDVDNLKAVNDRRGHALGNEVLRQFAEGLAAVVRRDVDLCFRFGGDEFLVLCPQTSLATAREVAQRACEVPETVPVCRDNGTTVSLGVIELKEGERPADFLTRADRVMYAVKRAGKNKVGVE